MSEHENGTDRWPETTLRGKVIIVAGAGGTYGAAISLALALAGASLFMCDVNAAALGARQRSIQAISRNANVQSMSVDLTDDADVARLTTSAASAWGGIDGFIHCAALLGGKPFLDYPIEEMDQMLRLNLRSVIVSAQSVAHRMRNGGSIVLIGSVGSSRAHADAVVYDACKGALVAGARAMAVDLAAIGLRVNVVAPSRPVDRTESLEKMLTSSLSLGEDGILRRDLANAVVFFASEYSRHITGQTLYVDNGLTATLRPEVE